MKIRINGEFLSGASEELRRKLVDVFLLYLPAQSRKELQNRVWYMFSLFDYCKF